MIQTWQRLIDAHWTHWTLHCNCTCSRAKGPSYLCVRARARLLNADWPAEQSLWNVNTSFSNRMFLKKGVGLHSSMLKHEVIMWSSDMIGCWRSDAHTTTHPGPLFTRTHPLLTSQYSAVRLKARAAQTSGVVFHTNTFKVHISFFSGSFWTLYTVVFFFCTNYWKEHFHTSSEYHPMKNATILFPTSRSTCSFSRSW